MYSHRTTITVFILVSLSYARGSGCARPLNCDNRLWSPWSSCDFPCGTWGTQSRSKINIEGCHEGCPYLTESRHCYGNLPVDCVLGVWSEWSSCSFHGRCNLSAFQTSIRSKLYTEGCGGTCKDAVFEKRKSCSCLNGGTPINGTCQCKEHYYGGCCMYSEYCKLVS